MIDLLFQIALSIVAISLAALTAEGEKAAFFSVETWSKVLIFFNGRKHGKELSK